MKIRISIVIVLVVAALLVISGCERSASKAPVATPTLNIPLAQAPVIVADDLNERATQVAGETDEAGEAGEAEEPEVEVIEEVATETPVATPTVVVEVPETVRPESYTLQQGEWPICIARRFDLNLDTFFPLNGLSMNSRPAAGTVLRIPAEGNWSPNHGNRSLLTHPASYIVKAGDTLNTIACQFGGVSPEQIAARNNLTAPFTLSAGQELQIP